MTTLTELRKLAEAATTNEAHITKLIDFNNKATPATILAMCDLIAQCKDALENCAVAFYEDEDIKEALAAIEQWEKK